MQRAVAKGSWGWHKPPDHVQATTQRTIETCLTEYKNAKVKHWSEPPAAHTQLSAVGCCFWLWTDSWSQLQLILRLCARKKRARIWLPTQSDALLHMFGRSWRGGVNTWAGQYCNNVSMPFVTSQGCFYVCAFEYTPSEKWSEQK